MPNAPIDLSPQSFSSMEISQTNDQRHLLFQDELQPGDHFGGTCLLDGGTRRATARAVTSMRLLAFSAKDFPVIVDHFSSLRQLLKESSLRSPKGEKK